MRDGGVSFFVSFPASGRPDLSPLWRKGDGVVPAVARG